MLRAGLLASQLWLINSASTLGEGARAVQPEAFPETLGEHVNCDCCRARMCTDELLSNLRCAECRQIELDRLFELLLRTTLFALGSLFTWLLVRHSE
jgi:hypothetical protein